MVGRCSARYQDRLTLARMVCCRGPTGCYTTCATRTRDTSLVSEASKRYRFGLRVDQPDPYGASLDDLANWQTT